MAETESDHDLQQWLSGFLFRMALVLVLFAIYWSQGFEEFMVMVMVIVVMMLGEINKSDDQEDTDG